MKRNKTFRHLLLPLILPFLLFIVFYEKIDFGPSHAGFWMILAMGIAIGVIITNISVWIDNHKK